MYDIRNERLGVTPPDSKLPPIGPVPVQTTNRYIGDVWSLQRKLRNIASYNGDIPVLLADGIFGESTEDAVLKFQQIYGLERTGIVNSDTWNKIVEISDEVDRRTQPADAVLIFNEGNVPINPGDKDNQLYINNTEFSIDMADDAWQPLEDVF